METMAQPGKIRETDNYDSLGHMTTIFVDIFKTKK
jgi:hypothetical protein